jgi:hypothetical protein
VPSSLREWHDIENPAPYVVVLNESSHGGH